MTGYCLDASILIDALLGHSPAHAEMRRIADDGGRMWISRVAWIEILSRGSDAVVSEAIHYLGRFGMDEIDEDVSLRAAVLRRDRAGLKSRRNHLGFGAGSWSHPRRSQRQEFSG